MLINNNFPSPNFSMRIKPIEYIIIHFTEMEFESALYKLTSLEAEVSAHYLIKEDGEIFRLVDDDKIAWHAGKSFWRGESALNQNSIGIELDNLGKNKFSPKQINSCLNLSQLLKQKYNIPFRNFIGHSDVAPARKIDPGIFFDWQFFAQNGLGIWHDVANSRGQIMQQFGNINKDVAKLQAGLARLGYFVEINGEFDMQTNYVVRSFQSKFYPEIIHEKGIEFYYNFDSKYSWDSVSQEMLDRLVLQS